MKTKKQIREYFRLSVIERDKYTCKVCGSKSNDINYFDPHRITDRSEIAEWWICKRKWNYFM